MCPRMLLLYHYLHGQCIYALFATPLNYHTHIQNYIPGYDITALFMESEGWLQIIKSDKELQLSAMIVSGIRRLDK